MSNKKHYIIVMYCTLSALDPNFRFFMLSALATTNTNLFQFVNAMGENSYLNGGLNTELSAYT